MTSIEPANSAPKSVRRTRFFQLASALALVAYMLLARNIVQTPWLLWPAIGFAALAIAFACGWIKVLDEAAQQAHYIAWYWGGSAGLALSALSFVAATPMILSDPAFFDQFARAWFGHPIPNFGFAFGFIGAVVPAVIGYTIWWIALWLRRR